jgi:hypothetical protein
VDATGGGPITVVGERLRGPDTPGGATSERTVAFVAQLSASGRLRRAWEAPPCTRLRAVTRLASGEHLACGDWGALVRLRPGPPEALGPVCGGHLHAIEAVPGGGAVTVGAGGHALSIAPDLTASLEVVQTTRDLLCLTLGPDGVPWAGAAQARILRRGPAGWIRMNGDLGTANVVAVRVSSGRVLTIGDDGTIIEGQVA